MSRYSSSGSPPQGNSRLYRSISPARTMTPQGTSARGGTTDLDMELEEKLMAIDMQRSGERSSSGLPRNWDLVSEVRSETRPVALSEVRPSASKLPITDARPSTTKLKASPRSPPGGIERKNMQRLMSKERFGGEFEQGRTKARVSYAEDDKNGFHSAIAMEKFLKAAGFDEVWMRGSSETKLIDADPAFHNFQDLRQIQQCDVFVAIINGAWLGSSACKQELELARKMHATSAERGVSAPGAPRQPAIAGVVLEGGAGAGASRELEFVEHVGHRLLTHPTPTLSGWDGAGRAGEAACDIDAATADTFQALRAFLQELSLVPPPRHSLSLNPPPPSAPQAPAQDLRASAMCDQAAQAAASLQEAARLVEELRMALDEAALNPAPAPSNTGSAGRTSGAGVSGRRGVLPTETMPFARLLASRYFGTLTHVMGGRMVWSLDITFENLVDPSTILEGEVVTGITGKVLYTLINYFPHQTQVDESTGYWARWSSVRIGHEALESIKCSFDPVQGLIIAEGVEVAQETAFEDGEGALINPYQKYRMLLCADGSMTATLFAGGDWDAAFRAVPF